VRPLTVVTTYAPAPFFEKSLRSIANASPVEQVLIVSQESVRLALAAYQVLRGGPLPSGKTLNLVLDGLQTEYVLLLPGARHVSVKPEAIERMLQTAESTGAGLVYSDFYDESFQGRVPHPLNDYRQGSVRDDFDFGAMMLFSVAAIRRALKKHGATPDVQFAGLYDLRLKIGIDNTLHHLKEPLYSVIGDKNDPGDEKLFAYVDPEHAAVQKEMEAVFTDYLRKIGVYLSPESLRYAEPPAQSFPVEASVVIPVLNRKGTIPDAVRSALAQSTDFPFNVIAVDNHSTDGTTDVLEGLMRTDRRLTHVIPERTDLGIGGCWNEAIHRDVCGHYAVQLDSDDLYSNDRVLQTIVDTLRQGPYAMVVGSYSLVNERLEQIPPGLVDHREWTDENGHNNALRVNGLGAPRAFDTSVIRTIGFPNVSYGEDYAVALRVCRQYRIGRIFESLYLCRRWPGNTDAALTIEQANRNDAFKDMLRTEEIIARQKMNQNP